MATRTTSEPTPAEDGLRITPARGNYEWWYFDYELEDSTKGALIFWTKDYNHADGPVMPEARLQINLPGEDHRRQIIVSQEPETNINAATDKCDVQIKNCTAKYLDNGDYAVHFESDDHKTLVDMKMHPTVPMWRPGDGYFRFKERPDDYFAWFVGAPSATVEFTYQIDGQTKTLKGTGYHDHNWGNVAPAKIMDHWYWCRAQIGDYTAIDVDIIGSKECNFTRKPVFMLAKGNKILSDNSHITVRRSGTHSQDSTGKFMDDHLSFSQHVDGVTYTVEYQREKDLSTFISLSEDQRKQAQQIGLDPTYVRCAGTARVTADNGQEKKVEESNALWEQMNFGIQKQAIINEE